MAERSSSWLLPFIFCVLLTVNGGYTKERIYITPGASLPMNLFNRASTSQEEATATEETKPVLIPISAFPKGPTASETDNRNPVYNPFLALLQHYALSQQKPTTPYFWPPLWPIDTLFPYVKPQQGNPIWIAPKPTPSTPPQNLQHISYQPNKINYAPTESAPVFLLINPENSAPQHFHYYSNHYGQRSDSRRLLKDEDSRDTNDLDELYSRDDDDRYPVRDTMFMTVPADKIDFDLNAEEDMEYADNKPAYMRGIQTHSTVPNPLVLTPSKNYNKRRLNERIVYVRNYQANNKRR